MSEFVRATTGPKGKPDEVGTVVVKIFRRDPKSPNGNAVMNGRKEEVVVEGTTVGKVYEAVERALFGDEKEE